ncbi:MULTISPECIES: pectate lyase family protein [unclassified Serratia (in: enterobacteria)]|uniref:pectate lyase family protein n=1 Tax=unclassified Serratia (in: enterobacteria) TaxID=2647522 RepID=UPI0030765A6A
MHQSVTLRRATLSTALKLILASGLACSTLATAADLGREVLATGDGWGSYGPGVTGGSAASDSHIYVVNTWQELRAALGGTSAQNQTTPRIIYVKGKINAMERAEGGGLLTCDDIAEQVQVPGSAQTFSMEDFIEHFDPAGAWGMVTPEGPLEEARVAATKLQTKQIQQRFGSNVTLIGVGKDAHIIGAHLLVKEVSNVIIRNLHISDAYDCFPEWDPTDGSAGNWNSLYDNISLMTVEHAWVDHVTLDDGDHPRQSLPKVYGRTFQVHDGLLDITHSSNYVTASFSIFGDHDKVNLIGSSDSRLVDRNKLKVTMHHNHWVNPGQRAPRVRFGQVDVYNNYSQILAAADFTSMWGVGVESAIYAEKNVIELASGIAASKVIKRYGGQYIFTKDNLVNGSPVDLLAVYNASASAADQLANSVGWIPALRLHVNNVNDVKGIVTSQAGSGKLDSDHP